MSGHIADNPQSGHRDRFAQALRTLLEAFDYAAETASDRWDFAVSIRLFPRLGLNESDIRWLVRKGYVNHAREVTIEGDNGRAFRPSGDLTFTRRTSFILTDAGVATARAMGKAMESQPIPSATTPFSNGTHGLTCRTVIHWDPDIRRLFVNGTIVKRFKWPAANQEAVLNAFQEEGWPERIADPLPPRPDQEPKRRLSDTIKCLNRKLSKDLIHFRGDGTGEGVLWERVDDNVPC